MADEKSADQDLRMTDLREIAPGGAGPYGGKAVGLVRLLSAGAKIPEGFAVEATALAPDRWTETDRRHFADKAMALLDKGPVAVRSSALCEDSAERSFAGLFETVLGVRSAEEALGAAARCVASGGSERVLRYAGAAGPLPVGLVVQSMAPAKKAGVCFTRDPSGKDSALLIEAVAGLGDALVSGRAKPERWRAYRSELGGWDCRPDEAAEVLNASEAASLALGAAAQEKALGQPLDLEWALNAEGEIWWLQARPITALKPVQSFVIRRSCPDADDGPVTVWSNWNVRETVPDPMMPLTFAFWTDSVLPTVGVQLFGLRRDSRLLHELKGLDQVNGRIYFNMNCLLAIPILGWFAPALLKSMDARAAQTVKALIAEGILRPRRLPGNRLAVAFSMLAASVRGLLRFHRALFPRKALRSLERDGASIAGGRPVSEMTDSELLREIFLFEEPKHLGILFGLQMETMAMLVYAAAARAFRGHPRALELLTTGIPANPTTQISLGIEELAEAAAPLKELFIACEKPPELLARLEKEPGGPDWLSRFSAFLDRFGHRGPMEFDLGAKRWDEDPTMILDLVRASLHAPPREGVRERMERLGRERSAVLAEALASSPFWRRPYMKLMARLVVLYMPLREAPKHYGMFAFGRIRRSALEVGRRLTKKGALDGPQDVFFLDLRELEDLILGRWSGGDLRPEIRSRQALHERFLMERAPDFVRSDGVPVQEEPAHFGPEVPGTLRGTPISAGLAIGPVKVLFEPDPKVISEGDVLVMVFADPGWTPLFPRAAAVVMEVGGLMCHAAVVAREMGIPAVFGVKGATSLLRDGQRVAVDGSAGTVKKV